MQFFPSQLFCDSHHPQPRCLCIPPTPAHKLLKKLQTLPQFFFSLPLTAIICDWVRKGISHERQWIFKVLHYLSNLKYRTSVLRQDFPALFNSHFEEFWIESKPGLTKGKLLRYYLKHIIKLKRKGKPGSHKYMAFS